MEGDLQQHVPQLLGQVHVVPAVDGVHRLIAFLKKRFLNRFVRLLAVPRAAARRAQAAQHAQQLVKAVALQLFKRRGGHIRHGRGAVALLPVQLAQRHGAAGKRAVLPHFGYERLPPVREILQQAQLDLTGEQAGIQLLEQQLLARVQPLRQGVGAQAARGHALRERGEPQRHAGQHVVKRPF